MSAPAKTAHAKLSPSSSHRWMNCAGSVELCKDIEDTGNAAAELGTGAHALNENSLRNKIYKIPEDDIGREFSFTYGGKASKIIIDGEMIEHCNTYLSRVTHHLRIIQNDTTVPNARLYLEKRVDLTHIRPHMFGSADCVIDGHTRLVIIDFKYGFVPVRLVEHPAAFAFGAFDEAEINTQLLIYAAGVAHDFGWLMDEVIIEIIQPRCFEVPSVQSITIPADWLHEWSEKTLRKAAYAADQPDAPLNPGSWCRWCPAAFKCSALASKAAELAAIEFADFPPENVGLMDGTNETKAAVFNMATTLNDEQLANVLKWTPIIDAWLRAVNANAFARMQRGDKIPGFKIVVGGKSKRFWEGTHEEILIALQNAGMRSEDLARVFEDPLPPELKSPAQMEKLSKYAKAAVKVVAKKIPGDTLTLTVDTDRRPAVEPLTEFEHVKEESVTMLPDGTMGFASMEPEGQFTGHEDAKPIWEI